MIETRKRIAASKAHVPGARVAFVYSSCQYDQTELLAGARAALPGAAVIGCTSFTGVLTPEGFITSPPQSVSMPKTASAINLLA